MPSGSSGGGGGAFDYVQGATPAEPQEGEEWYATGSGSKAEGAYVYDGANWIEQTVTDYSQLSGTPTGTNQAGPNLGGYTQEIDMSSGTQNAYPETTLDAIEFSIHFEYGADTVYIDLYDENGIRHSWSASKGDQGTWADTKNFDSFYCTRIRKSQDDTTTKTGYLDSHRVGMPKHSHPMP
ncbi:hypothetical protein ACKVMT_10055 [Halobacteriales archaeon Cl-PHB]